MPQAGSLTAKQIRAARALLDWSQDDLAAATELSIATIRKIEIDKISARGNTLQLIRRIFEGAGLEFIEPNGVRQRPDNITLYQGLEGFVAFYDDIYQTALQSGGEIVVVTPSEVPYTRALGETTTARHIARMTAIRDSVKVKCIITENTDFIPASAYCEYRRIARDYIDSVPFYVYGDKYAIILYDSAASPQVTVLTSAAVAKAFRNQFSSMWNKAALVSAPEDSEPDKNTRWAKIG